MRIGNSYRQYVRYTKVLLASLLCLLSAHADDYSSNETIPEVITLEWTEKQIQKVVTIIDVEDTSPKIVLDDFNTYGLSQVSTIKVDYSEVIFPDETLITLVERNISWIDIINHVASEIGAEVEIVPGKVILRTPGVISHREAQKISQRRPEKPIDWYEDRKLSVSVGVDKAESSFPWLLLGIVALIVALGFIFMRGEPK